MKIHKIVDRTFFGMKTNIYLIEAENPVLIDSGYKSGHKIISEIDKITGRLSAIVLTHNHPDHAGGAYKLSQKYECPVYIHELDLSSLRFPAEKIGNRIQLGDFEYLEVIPTPGHTSGGICLYDRKSKILFSGDTIFSNGNFGRFDLNGGSRVDLIESIRKLRKLDISTIYPGHDDVVIENAKENIEEAYKTLLALDS